MYQVVGGSTGYGFMYGYPGNGGNGGSGANGANGANGGDGGAGFQVDAGASLINTGRIIGGEPGAGGSSGAGGAAGAAGSAGNNANPAPNSGGTNGFGGAAGLRGAGGGAGLAGPGVSLNASTATFTNQPTGHVAGGYGLRAAPGTDSGGNVANAGSVGKPGGSAVRMLSGGQLTNSGDLQGGTGGTGGTGGNNVAGGFGQVGGNGGTGGTGGAALQMSGGGATNLGGMMTGGPGGGGGTPGSPIGQASQAGDGGIGAQLDGGATLSQSSTAGVRSSIVGGAGSNGTDNVTPAGFNGGNGGAGAALSNASTLTSAGLATSNARFTGGAGGNGGSVTNLTGLLTGLGGKAGNGGAGTSLSNSTFGDNGYSIVTGGSGGTGGDSSYGGYGGNGGDGGAAAVLVSGSSLTAAATSTYTGGNGGNGGAGSYAVGCTAPRLTGNAGTSGTGGAGLLVTSATVTNQATITGGNGGINGSATTSCATPAPNGAGGSGIVENGGAYVIHAGTAIAGFLGGSTNAADQAPAVALHNGGNTLELRTGFAMQGRVVSDSGTTHGGDTLAFGGSVSSGFDLGSIYSGGPFDGFAALTKTGSGVWQLTGNGPTVTAPTTIQQGTLQVDGVLTGSSITVNGGALDGVGSVGAVINKATVTPGDTGSVGTLQVASYTDAGGGALQINANASSAGLLSVAGTATLGSVLNVSFTAPPSGQSFTVLSANSISGTFSTVNISGTGGLQYFAVYTSNSVLIEPASYYSVGGMVSGLSGSLQVALTAKNPASTQSLSLTTNGSFGFTTDLPSGSGWTVSVTTQPTGQKCTVTNGSGAYLAANVTNVTVTCANVFTVTSAATNSHGTITPASQTITSGGSASFTLTPNTGFEVLSVTGDTCAVTQQGMSSTWTTSAITQNCAVIATFADYPSQCTGASNFNVPFFDDFSGNTLDPTRWTAYAHSGTVDVANNSVTLNASGSGFPYVAGIGNPIPGGPFSVRWIAAYGPWTNYGTGTLAVTDALPANGAGGGSNAVDAWQDGTNYRVEVATVAPAPYTATPSATQSQPPHDIEYCRLANSTEVWVDGNRVYQGNPSVPRPTALWFGNPSATFGGPWQAFTLYYVEVRALNDDIFKNGFGTPPGN
jgi:hypothetical protein